MIGSPSGDMSIIPAQYRRMDALEQLGAVEMFPNHQTRVSGLNPLDVRLVYPPLAALIQLAARTVAPSVTDEHIAAMTEFNERMLEASEAGDDAGARTADERFHAVLVEATENPYLTTVLDTLRIHLRRLGALYFRDVPPGRRSHDEHLAIIEALTRRDPEGTDEAIKAHHDRAVAELIAHAERSR
ncbi:GntR family transcriptional regulator [Actinomadura sp. KC216]|uniref:GntR family transcriptional regulator n=1 Tax=Actinomadura sp. KC216 TaxID=2530370 RepID=UPI001049E450|nr:GntR family transcriptional regulator [Actinomadura sp. KC216]TDB85241.1 GntR family transcriptional regulator [Actinomadura sp. KC216]